MRLLRHHITTRIFCLVIGLVFLNMGFFLAEVTMLKIENEELIENIASLITNSGAEEERDAESGQDSSVKEIDLCAHHLLTHHSSLTLIATRNNQIFEDHYSLTHYLDIFSPPPEV